MDNKKTNTKIITFESLLNYCVSDDYEEQKKTYHNIVDKIYDSSITSLICNIERLLKKKTHIEVVYSFEKGTEIIDEPLYNDFNIDEMLNLNKLYETNNEYQRIEKALITSRNNLRVIIEDELLTQRIESLFEVYSYCNYEIVKCSYYLGSRTNQDSSNNNKKIRVNNRMIGLKIQKCRNDANLTQAEMAAICNTKRCNISNYERGKTSIPISIILMYSKLFKVSISYLIDEEIPINNANFAI